MRSVVTSSQASQLLHNKHVVILGGSVQRSMYKDLVVLLQRDQRLTLSQLKSKGEISFETDALVEGGSLGPMTNGTEYREVRQYRSGHHLLRYYFLTRVYSAYMESILEDFRQGLQPDVVIVGSCVWDLTRYGLQSLAEYKQNLSRFFSEIKRVVCQRCLIVWVLAMPVGEKIRGGFLVPEVSHMGPTLRHDIIEANFYSSRLADSNGLDVLDLHFHFRHSLQHRMPDGIHWDALVHRRISSLLLQHAADAWGVRLPAADAGGSRLQGGRPQPESQHHSGGLEHHQMAPRWFCPRPPPPHSERPQRGGGGFQHRSSCFPVDGFQAPPSVSAEAQRVPSAHQLHYCRQQNFTETRVRPSPPPTPHPAPQMWPPAGLFQPQQHRPQIRMRRSQMGPWFRSGGDFHPHFQRDTLILRRRWRGMPARSHPYPQHPPWGTSTHAPYGW